MAVTLPCAWAVKDALFCLIDAWPSSVRLGAIKSPLIEECPLGC
jgi:hypothetical protein